MRDLSTISIHSEVSNNCDDGDLYLNFMAYENPRKLGRGSKRLGSGSWKLIGNMAPALLRSLHCEDLRLE